MGKQGILSSKLEKIIFGVYKRALAVNTLVFTSWLRASVPEVTGAAGWDFHLTPGLVASDGSPGWLPVQLQQN